MKQFLIDDFKVSFSLQNRQGLHFSVPKKVVFILMHVLTVTVRCITDCYGVLYLDIKRGEHKFRKRKKIKTIMCQISYVTNF